MLKLLFAGPMRHGSTTLARYQAFRFLGLDVHTVDYVPFCEEGIRTLRGLERRIKLGPGIWKLNRRLESATSEFKPDLIWLEKAIYIWPRTLDNISASVVHYSPDDYFGKGLYQGLIWRSLKSYAAVLTTKTFNVPELLQHGARKAYYVPNAFDPEQHRPTPLTPRERTQMASDVAFLGRWEPDREEILVRLAERGINLRVWGRDWGKRRLSRVLRSSVVPSGAWGADYAKVIGASKIVLNILSKWYRDDETTRSIEIPACGGFMLAERTPRHLEYFVEGKEAEFYTGFSELVEKVRYYLAAEEQRTHIASAGYARCMSGGYSYRHRMATVLEYLVRERIVNAVLVPRLGLHESATALPSSVVRLK